MKLATVKQAAMPFARWAIHRARERSTWAGAALLAAALGNATLSTQISHIGDAVLLILGSGLAAASTSQPADQPKE